MLEIVKHDVEELKIGMFVSDLDRPWLETPFLLQGFKISEEREIEQLKSHCRHVFVDLRQSEVRSGSDNAGKEPGSPGRSRKKLLEERGLRMYRDTSNLNEELPRAKAAALVLTRSIADTFDAVRKGSPLDVARIERSVAPMIESISRNPDACIWLAQLKQQDNYTYQHSLATSIWAVALGRQLGLPPADLKSLAVGGLLFDVGKLRVDPALLASEHRLEGEELAKVREHVQFGAEMLKGAGVSKEVLDMVLHHHERHDGSGYPRQLSDDQIPIFARIAAVVDAFDAMTSHRSYARGISPSAAIKTLHSQRGVEFQAEIVEEFIQAIGIYPAGTLVELSSGEVGVVSAECRTRRLRPRVLLLLDYDKTPLNTPRTLDLMATTTDSRGEPLDIETSLEPDAYGIDLSGLKL